MITIFSPEPTMRALALLPALGLAGCDIFGAYQLPPNLKYKVDVIELQSPCPKDCSTLVYELSDGEDGALHAFPYLRGDEWTTESGMFDTAGELSQLSVYMSGATDYSALTYRPKFPRGTLRSRGYDCALSFGITIEPEILYEYVQLQGITLRGRGDDVVALNEAQLQDPTLNWTMSLIGDFPLPTPDNEDYEAQIFHIVGGPDERVTPAEDACDDDPRSFWFDLQFTPVSPPQGPQR